MGKYDEYKKHWKQRAERERRRRQTLAAEARLEARRLGDLLVRQFGATRVYLFGSLTRDGAFHERSDIDLATEGLTPTSLFEAGIALDRACDYRYRVDLVDLETAREGMRELILEEGVLLCERNRDPQAYHRDTR
ncbi:MAG: nucleotidyltransferase family protein [Anaerolineae bacterium]